MIAHILRIMHFLLERYETAAETFHDDRFMAVCIDAEWSKVRKYFDKFDRSTAYIAVIVLNPVRKWAFFDDWDFAWNLGAKASLKRLWERKYCSSTSLPITPQEEQSEGELDNSF